MYRPNADPRGIPLVQRGISSTMPGTDPLGALLDKERRGKLNLHVADKLVQVRYVRPVRTRKRLGRRVRPEGRHF